MRNFHIKSILLGIGIGFILTSIISLIYTAGIVGVKISNQEIIEQAKKLGMVENTELIKNSSANTSDVAHSKLNEVKASTPQEIKLDTTAVPENPKGQDAEIKITISQGESSETVSEKLLKAGLITDKAAFLKELSEMGLTSEINIGEFKVKIRTDMKSIIRIITGTR